MVVRKKGRWEEGGKQEAREGRESMSDEKLEEGEEIKERME